MEGDIHPDGAESPGSTSAFTYYKSQNAMQRIMARLPPTISAQGASDLNVMLSKKDTDMESEEVQTLTEFATAAWVPKETQKRDCQAWRFSTSRLS